MASFRVPSFNRAGAPTGTLMDQRPMSATNAALPVTRSLETRLWIAQRLTAVMVAFCVVVHLLTIIVAVRGGLSAAEILGRLRGSTGWLAFYVFFVGTVAVHAAIGLRAVAAEWLSWRGRFLDAATFLTGALLLALGLRAVAGLFFGATT